VTEQRKSRYLLWALASCFFSSAFGQLTFFSSIFVLFLSQLGLPKGQIGLVLSMLPFCGMLAPFVAPAAARWGFKRTYVTFYAIRYAVAISLVFVPFVVGRFGAGAAAAFVSAVILVFAVCRAVAETGYYPWFQEFVPNAFRGRFVSLETIIGTAGGAGAIWLASLAVAGGQDITMFLAVIMVGIGCGIVSLMMMLPTPGGLPAGPRPRRAHLTEMRMAVKDREFRHYLLASLMIILSSGPVGFLPLFMKEQIGLGVEMVIQQGTAILLGTVLASILVGWMIDRSGSRPVLLVSVAVGLVPQVCWLVMPRHHALSAAIAYGGALVMGMANTGVAISSLRLLFNSLIPPHRRTAYTAINYACCGLFGGAAPLLAGMVLAACNTFSGKVLSVHIDPYTPVFLAGIVLRIGSFLAYRTVAADAGPKTPVIGKGTDSQDSH
jgi:MFS family permease